MRNNIRPMLLFAAAVVLFLLVSGCAKKKIVATTGPGGAEAEAGQIQEETLGGGLPGERLGRARRGVSPRAQAYGPEGIAFESEDVHFDFDQATLTPESRQILQKKAAFLQRHPEVQITIEGHCDQRGSSDYNLALGQRRADAVKTYLEDLGIAGNRLATVSYGKEQPLDPEMNEAAFARNRRAHLVIGGLTD
ncbi:MAG: peptidoglycan-associated lipoprotein Pal [Desulfobacca sp.]|uniref:peptidoglycan-associated lipoprotein Pal n=1 Tax=Desulfobacca sp. TaxID=2067990 RepID=UPI0040499EDE